MTFKQNKYLLILSLIGLITLFSSCRKDDEIEFTSDIPDGFRTDINIYYYEAWNKTIVYANFSYQRNDYEYPWKQLKLPANSHFKVNGTMFTWQPGYSNELDDKPICSIEFKDHDGSVYHNTMVPPDTAFFIDLPDTVSFDQDLDFLLNPPVIDSNESTRICLDGCGDDYGTIYIGTDSVITVDKIYLPNYIHEEKRMFELQRNKSIPDLNFPLKGGSITYHYIVRKSVYVE